MNNYILIDLKKLEILFLNKIDINYKENDIQAGTIKHDDKKQLVKNLEKIIKGLKSE